jgi:hypothetical protein
VFDETYREQGNWRIKSNPLSWGGENPTVVVLGFSKGPTQAGALVRSHHDQIAYKGSRENVGKILRRIGLLPKSVNDKYAQKVDDLISDKDGMFHFGSLIRCTVEQFTEKKGWIGSGGGMLDKFVATYFGNEVTGNCASSFLVVMFGLGTGKNYVRASRKLIEKARNTEMKWINDVSYSDDEIVVVHVEHFAAQGSLIPQWLGDGEYKGCERSRLSALAIQGVSKALSR